MASHREKAVAHLRACLRGLGGEPLLAKAKVADWEARSASDLRRLTEQGRYIAAVVNERYAYPVWSLELLRSAQAKLQALLKLYIGEHCRWLWIALVRMPLDDLDRATPIEMLRSRGDLPAMRRARKMDARLNDG